jgi:NTP pyrophosphatase (non-canonical NTP hydrolase)
VEIRDVQQRAWANKLAQGFNTSDVALEFGLLNAEVGEAFMAWCKRLPDLGEELADVLIYVAALAEMNGIDLAAAVDAKLAKNEQRVYRRDANGILTRVSDD